MIRIKPHHFVDIICQHGEGVAFSPHPFGHALHEVAARLLSGGEARLVVELGIDDICAPCRHNVGGKCNDRLDAATHGGVTTKHDYNLALDRRWCERLELEQGSELSVREFCSLLLARAGELGALYPHQDAAQCAAKAAQVLRGAGSLLAG